MGKRCSTNLSKKILLTLALVLTSVALSVCVLMGILLPYSIAYADSTQNVLIAPVSNLEGNAYAIASTLELTNGDDTFLIPRKLLHHRYKLKSGRSAILSSQILRHGFLFQSRNSSLDVNRNLPRRSISFPRPPIDAESGIFAIVRR